MEITVPINGQRKIPILIKFSKLCTFARLGSGTRDKGTLAMSIFESSIGIWLDKHFTNGDKTLCTFIYNGVRYLKYYLDEAMLGFQYVLPIK